MYSEYNSADLVRKLKGYSYDILNIIQQIQTENKQGIVMILREINQKEIRNAYYKVLIITIYF